MIILGIETSCDETALALVEVPDKDTGVVTEVGVGTGYFPYTGKYRIIHSLVHSQADLHSAYGGVYPSLAKREHGKNLLPLLHKLLIESELETKHSQMTEESMHEVIARVSSTNPDLAESFSGNKADFLKKIPKIDAIAVTEGPGLEPALWVGIGFARILGEIWSIPIVPINHMEGHIVGSLIDNETPFGSWQELKKLSFPSLALLISGGHTELVKVSDFGKYEIVGSTKDDAVGEAYDKAARLLGLPYPGGPHISRLAEEARTSHLSSPVSLPRPMINSGTLDFSFSGLKTAVLYAVRDHGEDPQKMSDDFKKGLAMEFEQAVTDTLDAKVCSAIEQTGATSMIVGGGVSANRYIRQAIEKTCTEYGIPVFLPSRQVSGDNALMIALAGAVHLSQKWTTKTPESLRAHGTKRLGDISLPE